MSSPLHVLVLAAGRGKRMNSDLPKVLHPVLFRPMLHHLLDLAHLLGPASMSVVVGFGEDKVRAACAEYESLQYLAQDKQLGTGDAVRRAEPVLGGKPGSVLVLSGDVVLLRPETLLLLKEKHERRKSAVTMLTAKVKEPRGYGRILRDGEGKAFGIREEADCSDTEREISEVNAGVYLFEIEPLFACLGQLENKNRQGEYYLTDVIGILAKKKAGISTFRLEDPLEMTGINDRAALADAESILQARVNRAYQMSGVTIRGPQSVYIDPRSRIEKEVLIEPGCQIVNSVIEPGAVIESHCRIVNSFVGAGSHIRQGSYLSDSQVGAQCAVGPYAHFRPGTRLEARVKIGNFVEVKKSLLREGAKASHLSYIGDADIGRNTNLGCGFITCNFDGSPKKHRTLIGDNVFVGSDSQTVAPVTVGEGSYIASGTTITEDVPPDSLALSRGRLVVKPGYAKKYRKDPPVSD